MVSGFIFCAESEKVVFRELAQKMRASDALKGVKFRKLYRKL